MAANSPKAAIHHEDKNPLPLSAVTWPVIWFPTVGIIPLLSWPVAPVLPESVGCGAVGLVVFLLAAVVLTGAGGVHDCFSTDVTWLFGRVHVFVCIPSELHTDH